MTLALSAVADAAVSQMYAALGSVLEKGAAYARSKNIEDSVLLNWRLAPDMFPLTRQVQIACDIPARGLARLAGAPLPSFPDVETTIEELRQRVAKTQAFINNLDRAKIDETPEASVSFPVGPETMTMRRGDYLQTFLLPNLYFHVTAAYAILRACGTPIGKADFLGIKR